MAPSGTLEIRGMSKAFPNVQALADVSLDVRPGEILALMGENGAGKSTLLKILNGDYQPDEGTMTLDGEAAARSRARATPAGPASGSSTRSPRSSRASTSPRTSMPASCRRADRSSIARRLDQLVRPTCGATASRACCRRSLMGDKLSPAQRQLVEIMRALKSGVRRPRPRRADLVADRRGGGAPVQARPAAARRGCRDHLREPPHQRDPAPADRVAVMRDGQAHRRPRRPSELSREARSSG